MEYLWIYLSGVVVYLVFVVWFNYQFDHNKNLKNVTRKEWKEDLRLFPLSWIVVLLGIIVTIWRFCGGQPSNKE